MWHNLTIGRAPNRDRHWTYAIPILPAFSSLWVWFSFALDYRDDISALVHKPIARSSITENRDFFLATSSRARTRTQSNAHEHSGGPANCANIGYSLRSFFFEWISECVAQYSIWLYSVYAIFSFKTSNYGKGEFLKTISKRFSTI